jgi:NTP pyrophosphatase (non-canonical NTP hydrolase)
MTAEEYLEEIKRTLEVHDRNDRLLMAGLGLPGEAGEVSDHLKKWIFQGHELDEAKLKEELGDLIWYFGVACLALGLSFEDVFEANRAKLRKRYPNGFSTQDSLARVDMQPEREVSHA